MLELESTVETSGSNGPVADSVNMRFIKEAFRAFSEDGVLAGVDSLLARVHRDAIFAPYSAGNQELHGPDEVRAFFRETVEAGASMTVRALAFEEHGDEVVVSGSIRLVHAGGGFAESQVRWTYRFRDGRVAEARWGPRHEA